MKKRIKYIIVFIILIILVVPIKFTYKDGGTIEYRALLYRIFHFKILYNDESYYISNETYWFPKNLHSYEYYFPVYPPNVNVNYNNFSISCNIGSYNWSKEIDGQIINLIADSINILDMKYNSYLEINDKNNVIIDTEYDISDAKYSIYNKDDRNDLEYDNHLKSLLLNNIKNGEYIVTFKVNHESNTAYYAFKIIINR